MKSRNRKAKGPGWVVAWIMQILEMLAASAAASLSLGLHPTAYGLALWLILPLLGALTSCRAVLQGLLNYAAWIAPPICLLAAHTAIWGYVPPAGAMLLSAFIALVGAATGEVLIQRKGRH